MEQGGRRKAPADRRDWMLRAFGALDSIYTRPLGRAALGVLGIALSLSIWAAVAMVAWRVIAP